MTMLAESITSLTDAGAGAFIVAAACTVAGTAIVFGTVTAMITKIATTRAREQTRRDIAAYVAEGSIDPDKAVEMIKAARGPGEIAGDKFEFDAVTDRRT